MRRVRTRPARPHPMDTGRDVQPEYQATIKSWERKVPWYRRISARTGLQGKLVLSFTFMLLIALGSSCWLFVNDSSNVIRNLMGEQAKEISRTLAMASETPLKAGDTRELNRIGRDLLKNRDVVAVAFWGPSGSVMAVACQDPDLVDWKNGGFLRNPRASSTEQLQTAHHGWVKALGSYVEVASPVLSYQAVVPTGAAGARREGPRLLGYVTVCLSQADNEQRVLQIELSLVLIGAVSILCSVPLVYLLVHRIFHPIRALVAATDRIAAGDLDAEVAIHRPDVIGTLARSFNEMVKRVRHQQGDLESANDKLADANRQLADANRDLEQKVFQ